MNIFGKLEYLKLYHKNGIVAYEFYVDSNGNWHNYTRDSDGRVLTYENSNGEKR